MDEYTSHEYTGPEYTGPEFSRSALLTIDLQRDFVAGIAGTAEVLPAVRRLTHAFREAGRPIVHVVRLYLPDGSNADLCRRTLRGMVNPHSPGSQLAAGLLPGGLPGGTAERELDPDLLLAGRAQEVGPGEHILYKARWSAFYGTPLLEHLAERAVSTVVVAGCNYPNCPRSTLVDATERDLRAVAVRDALSGWTAGADRELAGMGIACLDTSEVVAAVRSRAASRA
ncbi:cysteine hydrolase [Microbispora hainanensis]|uniref:cysteine hydrolase family protein n=1 Tax=Microbispora hainanensis TaxID=568844 RepID=UPI002E2B1395|nr:isochorismatase family cysteine hydrolase [Microbispora hainanensis]